MPAKHWFRTIESVLLTFVLVISTTPISAADLPRTKAALGFIAGAGNVQLRGLTINHEATLFSGDAIRIGSKSHARVMLVNGNQVELFGDTKSDLLRIEDKVRLTLTAGNLGFNVSDNPLIIALTGFEVLPGAGAKGGVAFLSGGYVGIRVITGSATVVNVRTNKGLTVTTGNVSVINLETGQTHVPLAQLASAAAPSLPLPTAAPQQPTGTRTGAWIAIVAGIGAGTATALYFLFSDSSPSRPR